MKKTVFIMILATIGMPLFGMNQITPLSATPSNSTNTDNNVITIQKHKSGQSIAYTRALDTADTETLTVRPFSELFQEQKPYKLACIVESGYVHCFDAESLNTAFLHHNRPWRGFQPQRPYQNPLTRADIADVDYFEINNQTCTYKFSYNDFVTNRKSLEDWNAYFPHNRIINGVPRDLEGQVVGQRILRERVRDYINDPANRTKVYAGLACAGLTGLSVIAGSMALLSHHM